MGTNSIQQVETNLSNIPSVGGVNWFDFGLCPAVLQIILRQRVIALCGWKLHTIYSAVRGISYQAKWLGSKPSGSV